MTYLSVIKNFLKKPKFHILSQKLSKILPLEHEFANNSTELNKSHSHIQHDNYNYICL